MQFTLSISGVASSVCWPNVSSLKLLPADQTRARNRYYLMNITAFDTEQQTARKIPALNSLCLSRNERLAETFCEYNESGLLTTRHIIKLLRGKGNLAENNSRF